MTQCRYCKTDFPEGATRCPHCTSFLDDQPQVSSGQVAYVVDKGLISFAKFSAAVLAVFLTCYGLDLKELKKETEATYEESKKLDGDIKEGKKDLNEAKTDLDQAKGELKRDEAELKRDAELAAQAAEDAKASASRLGAYLQQAKQQMEASLQQAQQSNKQIEQIRITLLAPTGGTEPAAASPASFSDTVERIVNVRLLEALRDVLPSDRFSALQSKIAEARLALRRQVFDCNGNEVLPGELARQEGDAAKSDPAVNEVYENLATTYHFFKDVFSRDSVDGHGKSLVASVHYGKDFDNAFWNGQQLVLGDGDGKIFRTGAFTGSLDIIGHEIGLGIMQYTAAQLPYRDQSGALLQSIADVFGSMVKQWANNETVDHADWLIGEKLFPPGFKGRALRDMANPGTAYDDPSLGKDTQPGHMKDYVKTKDDNGGVHINVGIPNRAFVLAARAIGGRSWEGAGKIWYMAATQKIAADADFAKFAHETVSVAKELYPGDPSIAARVGKAWADVGVLADIPASSAAK